MGRGSNWLSADDVQMCKSWLHISEDPIVGTNQKHNSFWDKIMTHMQENGGDPSCTVRAAQSRFALINKAVSEFVGVHAQQQRSAPSGTNAIDIERRAFEAYRHESPHKKSFDFKECWFILRENEKWASPVQPQHGQQEHVAGTDQVASPDPQQPPTPLVNNSLNSLRSRPMGVKRAKADLVQGKAIERAVIAVEAANLLAKKRQRIMQEQLAFGYFKLQDHDMPPELREVFRKTRARCLSALEEDEVEAVPQPPPVNSPEDGVGDANSPVDDDVPSPSMQGYASDGVGDHMYNNLGTSWDEECYVTHELDRAHNLFAAQSSYVQDHARNHYVAGASYVQDQPQSHYVAGASYVQDHVQNHYVAGASYVPLADHDLTLGI